MKLIQHKMVWLPTWQGWGCLIIILAAFLFFAARNLYHFLAVTHPVQGADILIVEEWVPETVIKATADEFKRGKYQRLIIVGIDESQTDNHINSSRSTATARHLAALGIAKESLHQYSAPTTHDHKSAAMANTLRHEIQEGNIRTTGLNIMAPAAHARKTWLVYRRAFKDIVPVGILSVPTDDFNPSRWWETTSGKKWVFVNSIGWLYELFTGF